MGDQSSFVGHGPLPRAETMTYGASNRMTSSSLPVSSSTTASSATTAGRHHPTNARPRRRLRERPKSGMYGDSNDTHNKDSDANHADVTSVATDGNIGDTEDEDVRVIEDDDVDDDVDVETLTTVKLVDDDFVDDDDDEVAAIEESCAFCDSIESKMESLEQQLEVLREVVKLCTHNEQELQRERALSSEKSLKRSKTWIGRIPNPFNNAGHSSSASASTRIKLREEVDALRKATDILFQKLEETSPSK